MAAGWCLLALLCLSFEFVTAYYNVLETDVRQSPFVGFVYQNSSQGIFDYGTAIIIDGKFIIASNFINEQIGPVYFYQGGSEFDLSLGNANEGQSIELEPGSIYEHAVLSFSVAKLKDPIANWREKRVEIGEPGASNPSTGDPCMVALWVRQEGETASSGVWKLMKTDVEFLEEAECRRPKTGADKALFSMADITCSTAGDKKGSGRCVYDQHAPLVCDPAQRRLLGITPGSGEYNLNQCDSRLPWNFPVLHIDLRAARDWINVACEGCLDGS